MQKGEMIRDAACAALAGLAATGPMTAAVEAARRVLPRHEQYSLPPRQITIKVAEKVGVREHLEERHKDWLTGLAHFGYGAAVGALYGLAMCGSRRAGPASGIVYGLGVWIGSYLGLLPSLRILRPATEHPPRRNGLMIGAHIVWGWCTGALVKQLQRRLCER